MALFRGRLFEGELGLHATVTIVSGRGGGVGLKLDKWNREESGG